MEKEMQKNIFKKRILPETLSDEEIEALFEIAKGIILDRRYPFGYSDATEVPARYHLVQIDMAVELFNKSGAEGQLSHSENGISRTYQNAYVSNDLLKRIIPLANSSAES